MARCGCTSTTCSCAVKGGTGVVVTGVGTTSNPYLVNVDAGKITVDDTPTVDMKLTGSGSSADYYHLSATVIAHINDLVDVTSVSPASGNVLAWNGTQWVPVPPVTAAPGLIHAGNGITGDGSAGTPLAAKANPALGIQVDANGIGLQSGVMAAINSIGSWRSYTPKLYTGDTTTGVGISGTPVGRYFTIGKLCIAYGSLTTAALAADANVTLPFAAATRELNVGTLVNYGSSGLAADQSGIARIISGTHLDRIVLNAYTGGWRDAPSGSALTWNVAYETV